ncbi:8868_t:CDS:2 [Entrophospora sp. SA101]|nr:8868_t:CDS:2 [Entrophospora sp. SA101]
MDSLISTNSTTSIVGSINSPIPPPTTITTATTITSSKPFIRHGVHRPPHIINKSKKSTTSSNNNDNSNSSNSSNNYDDNDNNEINSSNNNIDNSTFSFLAHYCSQEYQRIYGNSDGNLRTENTEFSILLDYCNQEYHRTTITITNMICPDYYYSTTLNQYVDVNKLSRLVKYGNEEYLREFSN